MFHVLKRIYKVLAWRRRAPYHDQTVSNWSQLRRLVVFVCVGAVLLAAVAPTSSGFLFAILVPPALLTIVDPHVGRRIVVETPAAPGLVFLSLVTGRAPPIL
jgi:hypothetical protein